MTARYEVHCGDALAVLPTLPAESFDAVVTDPPYHLTQASRRGSPRKPGTGPCGRIHVGERGFMGKTWDGGDVANRPETWAAVMGVAKPGAHLLAFGGTRTWHRLACAIEDAGWEIRDCLMWLYGQGWPKTGGTLKPGWEPVILARKPGKGELRIEECRLPVGAPRDQHSYIGSANDATANTYRPGRKSGLFAGTTQQGRWPANVAVDEEVAAEIDAATPGAGQVTHVSGKEPSLPGANVYGDWSGRREPFPARGDFGGASRFFYCSKARGATARGGDFNTHPTVKPSDLMRWLVRLVAAPGSRVLDPFTGSGSTGVAALAEGRSFVGIEQDPAYVEIANRRLREALEPGGQTNLFARATP